MERVTWTDARMDDFAKHTDQRFDGVDKRLESIDRRFDSVDRRLESLDGRFASLQRTLMVFHGAIIAALIGLIATQL